MSKSHQVTGTLPLSRVSYVCTSSPNSTGNIVEHKCTFKQPVNLPSDYICIRNPSGTGFRCAPKTQGSDTSNGDNSTKQKVSSSSYPTYDNFQLSNANSG